MDWIANTVSTTLLAAGLLVWARVAFDVRRGASPVVYRERQSVEPSLAVVFPAICWIGLQLASQLQAAFVEIIAQPSPSLKSVRLNCAISGGFLLLLAAVILSVRPRSGDAYGFDFREWRRDVIYGVLGFLAAWPAVLVVLLVTPSLRTPDSMHSLLKLLTDDAPAKTIFWIALAAIVLAPLLEELLYRVVLQGALEARTSPAAAIATSSLVFAFVHSWPDSLALVPLALVLGYIYHRRRSYLAVVVVHALFNFWNLLAALFAGPDNG